MSIKINKCYIPYFSRKPAVPDIGKFLFLAREDICKKLSLYKRSGCVYC